MVKKETPKWVQEYKETPKDAKKQEKKIDTKHMSDKEYFAKFGIPFIQGSNQKAEVSSETQAKKTPNFSLRPGAIPIHDKFGLRE